MRAGQETVTIQHVAVDKCACAPSQSRHTESKHSKLGNKYPDIMMFVALVILLSSAPCAFSIVFALPHKIGRYRVSTCSRHPNHLLLCSCLLLLRGAAGVAAGDLLPLVPGPGHLALPAAGRRQGGGAPAARHPAPEERGGELPECG